MCMPARRSRSVVAGPTPGITVTCIGRSRSISVPGGTTTSPSGLSRSLATLAMNFDVPTPDRRGQPAGDLGDLLALPLGDGRHGRDLEVVQLAAARSTKASSSDSGSTSGEVSRSTAITCSLAVR